MEAGLVFVKTTDIFSEIILSITKEEYNYLGFYINTDYTGLTTSKVFIFDVFKGSKIDLIPELPLETTLDHLCVHPLIKKVSKKKLKNFDNAENLENFKLGILTALNSHKPLELIPAIYKLFGYNCDPVCIENKNDQWCSQSVMDLINNTFITLGIWDHLKFTENSIDISSDTKSTISKIASNFTTLPSKNLSLNSFLKDTNYFEKVIDLEIYYHADAKYSEDLTKYQNKCIIKISELLNGILMLTTTNKGFEIALKESFEYTKKHKSHRYTKIINDYEYQISNFDKFMGLDRFIDLSKLFIERLKNK